MELLIRTEHSQPMVSVLSEHASQRGDLIAAQKDGWNWTAAEKEHPDWIIIKSNISYAQVAELMESGRPGEPQWFRRVGINVEGLVSGDTLQPAELMKRTF